MRTLLIFFIVALLPSWVAAKQVSPQLQACFDQSSKSPDLGYAAAQAWLRQQPGNRDAQLCMAMALFDRNAFPEAAEKFQTLADTANSADEKAAMLEKAGWAQLRAGYPDKADDLFSSAIEISPDEAIYWAARASACMQGERYWDAVADLTQAIKLGPKNADYFISRAQAWLRLDQTTKAHLDARAALEIDQKNAPAWRIYELTKQEKQHDTKSQLDKLMDGF